MKEQAEGGVGMYYQEEVRVVQGGSDSSSCMK